LKSLHQRKVGGSFSIIIKEIKVIFSKHTLRKTYLEEEVFSSSRKQTSSSKSRRLQVEYISPSKEHLHLTSKYPYIYD